MKSLRLSKIKLLPVILIVALALVCIMPATAFAAPGDMTIEYRYLEGQTLNVPTTVVQLNREYRLVSQSPPVLESTLPVTRTYTYEIDGPLSDEDLEKVANIPGLTVEKRQDQMEREVEKTVTLTGLSSNDVSALPASQAPATMPTDTGTGTLQRSGIEFTVTGTDGRGLPSSYSAEVIYRGIETYTGDVYYAAESTYQTTEQDGAVDQYVIVATYSPVVPLTPAPAPTAAPVAEEAAAADEPEAAPEETEAAPEETETAPEEPVVPEPEVEETVITEEEVPLAPGVEEAETTETIEDAGIPLSSTVEPESTTNPWLWIIIAIVVVAAVLLAFFLIRKKRAGKSDI